MPRSKDISVVVFEYLTLVKPNSGKTNSTPPFCDFCFAYNWRHKHDGDTWVVSTDGRPYWASFDTSRMFPAWPARDISRVLCFGPNFTRVFDGGKMRFSAGKRCKAHGDKVGKVFEQKQKGPKSDFFFQ
jgi:hypothetical protein